MGKASKSKRKGKEDPDAEPQDVEEGTKDTKAAANGKGSKRARKESADSAAAKADAVNGDGADEKAEKGKKKTKGKKKEDDVKEEEEETKGAAAGEKAEKGKKKTRGKKKEDDVKEEEAETKSQKEKKTKDEKKNSEVKVEAEKAESEAESKKKVQLVRKGRSVVDPLSHLQKTAHVLELDSAVFDVMLNQTDVTYNVQGHNKFYKMQLLELDTGKQWFVWTRWGRVGSDGQNKKEPFFDRDDAIAAFAKKFKDKTNNKWDDRDNFKFVSGKYDMIEIDHGAGDATDQEATAGSSSASKPPKEVPPSKLDQRVQDLMNLISNVKMMEQALIEMEIDIKKMPLGKLSKRQIREGYDILRQLEEVLKGEGSSTVADLTNRFYTKIPHDFGRRKPPIIKDLAMLQAKMSLLETLGDIEIATTLMKEGDKAGRDLHPLDANYSNLHCDLAPLDKTSDTYKMILEMVANTHAPTHTAYTLEVEDIFLVKREGEEARYEPFRRALHNRMLLWHGSRLTNFMGILSQGLRIAPPEAPSTGYMFGKGVYFADMVSKSANYCATSHSNDTGIILLSEVALGDMYELREAKYMDKPPKGKHSTKGCGSNIPDPSAVKLMPDPDAKAKEPKVAVHLGKPVAGVKKSSLLYNEYIVYDQAQSCIRYLVKLKFNYK